MKEINLFSFLVFSSLLFSSLLTQAQWLPVGTTTGNIYYNSGNVGLGTGATVNSKFEVRNGSIRVSDLDIRYLNISHDAQGQPYGRVWSNGYAGGRQFKLSEWSHLPDNSGSVLKDIIHFDGYNLLLLKDNGGSVGIGTTAPDAKLTVLGTIHSNEVKVDLSVPGPDYVFETAYRLLTLEALNAYINVNKHLPEVPSACAMEENGINLGEMNMLLLKKIEELTLYMLEQQKEINQLKTEVMTLKSK